MSVPYPQWEHEEEIYRLLHENKGILDENKEALAEARRLLPKPWRWFRLWRMLDGCDARIDRVNSNLEKVRMLRGE